MKLVLPLVLLAAPAFAECPTAADMERGVVVTYSDGSGVTARRLGRPDLLEMEVRTAEGVDLRIELLHGTYVLSSRTLAADGSGGLMTFDYGTPIGSLTPPAALARWAGMAAIQSERGGAQAPHGEQRVYGPLDVVTVGGCLYDGFELALSRDDGYVAVGWFLQDLGFAVRRWSQPAAGPRLEVTVTNLGVSE